MPVVLTHSHKCYNSWFILIYSHYIQFITDLYAFIFPFYIICNCCHLQVTAENFDELFEIEAKGMISKVQQCSPPSFTWVVCSQSSVKMTNHCNQSGSGVPVKHLEDPSHCPFYLQPVPCNLHINLVSCKFVWLRLEVFLSGVPVTGRVRGPRVDLDVSY